MQKQRTTWFIGAQFTWSGGESFGDTPIDAVGSMGRLVTRIAAALNAAGATDGLVLLDGEIAARTGLSEPTREDGRRQRALDSAAEAGWRHGKIGDFTSFFAQSRPTVHVAQLARLNARQDPRDWPFRAAWPADTVAALQAFHTLSGVPWQAGPPVMGLELMHKTITSYTVLGQKGRRKPDLKDDSSPAEAGVSMWTPQMWYRPSLHPYMHSYDKRRAGITAAGVAKLSPAKLIRGRHKFDPKRAGWWLISVPPWNFAEMPHPCGPGADTYARLWVTTAQMDLCAELAEHGVLSMPDVIDSLTGPARQVLQPWQQTIERTYSAPIDSTIGYDDVAQALVRTAVKAAGNAGIGMLDKADGNASILRRDWAAGVNATKQANAFRTAWKIGTGPEKRWPIAFDDDATWYASDDPDPVRAAPKALNLTDDVPGAYRVQDTVERNKK